VIEKMKLKTLYFPGVSRVRALTHETRGKGGLQVLIGGLALIN